MLLNMVLRSTRCNSCVRKIFRWREDKINNIPDKCKAYYTTDGTTPTSSSTEYTGEFDMPTGNTVIAFVIINDHEQSSTVVKRNYNVEVKNTYTYSQAESQLKNVLISKKVLKSDSVAQMVQVLILSIFQRQRLATMKCILSDMM